MLHTNDANYQIADTHGSDHEVLCSPDVVVPMTINSTSSTPALDRLANDGTLPSKGLETDSNSCIPSSTAPEFGASSVVLADAPQHVALANEALKGGFMSSVASASLDVSMLMNAHLLEDPIQSLNPVAHRIAEAPLTETSTSTSELDFPQDRKSPASMEAVHPLRETVVDDDEISASPASLPLSTAVGALLTLDILPLNTHSFYVPLPMVAIARDIYEQHIKKNQKDLIALSMEGSHGISTSTAAALDQMLAELGMVCDNSDLLESGTTQDDLTLLAKHAEDISTKCMFLVEVLTAMRDQSCKLVIFIRPGRMQAILEAILDRHEIKTTRTEANSSAESLGLTVTLLPTGRSERNSSIGAISCVIAFDRTCTDEDLALVSEQDSAVPVLHLVTTETVEHIELCLPKFASEIERRSLLCFYATQRRKNIGQLPSEFFKAPEEPRSIRTLNTEAFLLAARQVAHYIYSADAVWPLPPMPPIKDVHEYIEMEPSQVNQTMGELGSSTQSHDDTPETWSKGHKRFMVRATKALAYLLITYSW